MKRLTVVLLPTVLSAVVLAPPAEASLATQFGYAPNVHVSLDGQAFCDNSKTTIKLWGTFSRTTGLGADVTFTNAYPSQAGKTYTVTQTVSATVTFPTGSTFSKNGAAGVGGNPYISVGFATAGSTTPVPLSERLFIGRCVQGPNANLLHVEKSMYLKTLVSGVMSQLDCQQAGPSVALTTTSSSAGVNAVVYLDNNKNKIVHWADAPQAKVSIGLAPSASYKKSDQASSAGGNPLVDLVWKKIVRNADGTYSRVALTLPDGSPAPSIHGIRCNKI